MVKGLSRFLLLALFFVLALMYFMPKVSLYYALEQELKKYAVIVSAEELTDNGLTLSITQANISVKGVDSASIEAIKIGIFGVYSYVDVKNIVLSSAASSFIPLKIKTAELSHTLFNPLNAAGYASGEFGELNLNVNILQRELHLVLKPSKKMLSNYKNTLKNLKKNENGEYVYDKTF